MHVFMGKPDRDMGTAPRFVGGIIPQSVPVDHSQSAEAGVGEGVDKGESDGEEVIAP